MSQGDLLLTARENAPITSAEEGSVANRTVPATLTPLQCIRRALGKICFWLSSILRTGTNLTLCCPVDFPSTQTLRTRGSVRGHREP